MDPANEEITAMLDDILTAIYGSQIIPEGHKADYVAYLKENGVTEKFATELSKIFEKEVEAATMSIEEKTQLAADLKAVVDEEMAKNDETQAGVVKAVDDYTTALEEYLPQQLDHIEKEMVGAVEKKVQESESGEITDIKASLGLKEDDK
jgi:hypothetical protein